MELSRRVFLKSGLAGSTAIVAMPASFALAQTVCVPASCTIWAGQTSDAGTITVSNNSTDLIIDIALTGNWTFKNVAESLKVWVGSTLLNMPQTNKGTPIPGQFLYKVNATGTGYQMIIPLSSIGVLPPAGCGSTLYVVAHLDVTDGTSSETAFGGCRAGAGPRWWFYMTYVICCPTTEPPPELGSCETAFAKGQYVWTTGAGSNPDGLPSLNLIKNRWGWAINLQSPGVFEFPVYAGAGLNDTSRGFLVGTVTVTWYDSDEPEDFIPDTVVVSYQLADGYKFTEGHVYIGKYPPKTTAPGQYGINLYPTSCNQDSFSTGPRPLVDNTVDADVCKKPPSGAANPCSGVWIVAHAVVCDDDDVCL